MKTIYFIRHAKSSWADFNLADHDRPLNARGKRDAPFMAELLKKSGVDCDGILTSTAKRARKTAKKFRQTFDLKKENVILTRDLYHAYPEQISRAIRQLPDAWDTVLVFGHNPGFTDMANLLQGAYIDNVPTCGIVGCQSEIVNWAQWKAENAQRHRYYYPKQFQ